MPVFEVIGPSGLTLELEGDAPPSESELDSIFAEAQGQSQPASKPQSPTLTPSLTPVSNFSDEIIGLRPTTPANFFPSQPELRAPEPPSIHSRILQGAEAVGRTLSPLLGPTEMQRLEAGPEGFRPLGSTIEREGFIPGMFTPSERGLVKLPHMAPKESAPAQILAGAYNGLADAANVMTSSPGGLLTAGVGSALANAKAALKAMSAAFALDMGTHLPGQLTETLRVLDDPSTSLQDKSKAVTGFLTSTIFTAFAAKHGFSPTQKGAINAIQERGPTAIPLGETSRGGPKVGRQVRQPETSAEAQAQAPQEVGQSVRLTPEEWGRDVAPVLEEVSDSNVRLGKTERGAIAQLDPATGDVVLSESEFGPWLRGIEPSKRQQAVRSTIAEEVNHRKLKEATTPEERADYWENLTAAEKALHLREYVGEWGLEKAKQKYREATGRELTPELLGYEAANARQMRLARMTRREVLEAVGREKWTLQSVDALANIIFKTREALGTKASKAQLEILDRVTENLGIARAAVIGQAQSAEAEQPFAFNKDEVEKGKFMPVLVTESGKLYPGHSHADAQMRAIKSLRAGEITPEEFSDITLAMMNDEQHKFVNDAGEVITREQAGEQSKLGGAVQSEDLAKAGLVSAIREPVEAPLAYKKRKETSEQGMFFLPPAPKGIERPGAVESGAEVVTPAKISQAAAEHLSTEQPSFKRFAEESSRRFGGVKPAQLRDAWEDAVWKSTMEASGEKLSELRRTLKLERDIGTKQVADALAPEQAANPVAVREARAVQNYRKTVQSSVARKLIEQSYAGESLKKALGRQTLDVDDLAHSKPGFFREISAEEAANPTVLSRLLTEDFRGMQAGTTLPESNTRRVVALVDKTSGEVRLVSVYEHPRTGTMVVDPRSPSKARPNVLLGSLLKQYRPIATALLDEPIRNFHQKFGSVGEFNEKFANDARAALEAQAAYESSLEEGAGVIEGEQAMPSALRTGQRLTDAEAGSVLDHLNDEVGKIESADDVRLALAGLTEKPNWQVISAYQKMFESTRRKYPDLTPEQALDRLTEELYANANQSQTRERFTRQALASYEGETPESVQGEPLAFNKRTKERAFWAARGLTDPVGAFNRWYGQWLSEAVRSNGGERANEAATIADAIVDRAKKLYGEQTDLVNPAKELAGGSARLPVIGEVPNPAAIKRNVWLQKLAHPVSRNTGIANVQEAVEGRLTAPPALQPTINAIGLANLQAGRLVQRVTPGFVPSNKWQRNMTPFGYDMLAEGSSHPNWKSFTRDTALDPVNQVALRAANPAIRTRGDAIRFTRQFFREWGEALKDPTTDVNRIEKVNQDFKRFFPRAVTHVRTPIGYQEVIHANPVNYLEFVAQRAAFTRAFREQFPPTTAGRRAFAQLDAGVRGELPPNIVPYWDALVRTMQSRPADSYTSLGPMRPGAPLGEFIKGFNSTALATLKRLALSAQAVMGAPETLGTGVAELGMRNKLAGAAKLKQLWHEFEKRGQVNAMIYDWSFDPSSPIRSLFRQSNNILAKGFAENLHNELQGRWNAATATAAADRIRHQQAEPLSAWEKRQYPETFRKMQFTKDQVSAMMQGDEPLLQAFERRFPSWMSGENAPMAERSMGAQKRWFNSVFAFQPYPMTIANQFTRNLSRLGEAYRTGTKAEKIAATEGMARFIFAKGGMGLGYLALGSLISGGLPGLGVKANEAKDEPMQFMLEALLSSLSGPYYLVWQAMRRGGGLAGAGETVTRTAFPFSQFLDVQDMVQGNGQYRDQDLQARVGRYFLQKVPAARAIRQGLAAAGLADANPQLEAAMAGAARWKRDELGWDQRQSFREEDTRKQFRTKMRAAVTALQKNDLDTYLERLAEAVNEATELGGKTKPTARVASSLRGRRILRTPDGADLTPEQLDALSKRIGENAMERLRYYDATLEGMAKSLE